MEHENHKEIRKEAARLAWVLSHELKCVDASNGAYIEERVKLIGEGISYLLAVAVDDWVNITGTCREIEQLNFPAIMPYLEERPRYLWSAFCEKVAKEEGCNPPVCKIFDIKQELTKNDYKTLGIRLGYLKFKRSFWGESKAILDE
ncbi:hypothetical protein SEZ29_004453 [Escherichia coli]|nr:hypothetical protein [Escherichia coli]